MKTILWNSYYVNPQAYLVFPNTQEPEKGEDYIEPCNIQGQIEVIVGDTIDVYKNVSTIDFSKYKGDRIRIEQYTEVGSVVLGEWQIEGTKVRDIVLEATIGYNGKKYGQGRWDTGINIPAEGTGDTINPTDPTSIKIEAYYEDNKEPVSKSYTFNLYKLNGEYIDRVDYYTDYVKPAEFTYNGYSYFFVKPNILTESIIVEIVVGSSKVSINQWIFLRYAQEATMQADYVDLGLPSGLLWAKYNLGATSEEEPGLYFQWGDTQGYTAEQVGNGEGLKPFDWGDYKFSIDGSSSNFSKYNASDSKTVLDPEDDAAHVNMGGNWRMPTFEEYKELCLNTDIYLVPTEGEEIQGTVQEQSGSVIINWASQAEGTLKGVKFYKKGDEQTYMFVPVSGVALEGSMQDVGQGGYLWSSSLVSSGVQSAWGFFFGASYGYVSGGFRYYGLPVRGVRDAKSL